MKKTRVFAIVLSLVMVLTLTSCALLDRIPDENPEPAPDDNVTDNTDADPVDYPDDQSGQGEEDEEQPERYYISVETETLTSEDKADDGTVVARASVELPVLVARTVEEGKTGIGAGWSKEDVFSVCDTFNQKVQEQREAIFGRYDELIASAKNIYADESGRDYIKGAPLTLDCEVKSVWQTDGGFLSAFAEVEVETGGVQPQLIPFTWNYDMNVGYFVPDYDGLAEYPAELKSAVSNEVTKLVKEEGESGIPVENWDAVAYELERTQYYLCDKGLYVVYPQFEISYTGYDDTFFVPYHLFSNYFGDRANMLIRPFVDPETDVLVTFMKAQQLWNYFNMCSMNTDPSAKQLAVDGYDYCLVDQDYFTTMEYLENELNTVFSSEITDSLLNPTEGPKLYIEIDGRLYTIPAARGSNILRGEETYKVTLGENGTGVVTVTVEDLDYPDDFRSEFEVVGHTDIDFPFVTENGGVRFISFESIR